MNNEKMDLSLEIVLDVLTFNEKWSISAEQYAILRLANNERLIMSDIANQLPISSGTMCNRTSDLSKKGYVKKVAPDKGHGYVILVTEKGKNLIKEIQSHFAKLLQ